MDSNKVQAAKYNHIVQTVSTCSMSVQALEAIQQVVLQAVYPVVLGV